MATTDPIVFQQGTLALAACGAQLEDLKYAALLRELLAAQASPLPAAKP